jgi:hypothetical protein
MIESKNFTYFTAHDDPILPKIKGFRNPSETYKSLDFDVGVLAVGVHELEDYIKANALKEEYKK